LKVKNEQGFAKRNPYKMNENNKLTIDEALVRHLVVTQFPQLKDLPIRPVIHGGWDNRTFHLGEHMLVRMPSAACYAAKVDKEQEWLPKLAPLLPLQIPEPLAMGKPGKGYPWPWSMYRWIEGETAAFAELTDLKDFAMRLAQFLVALHRIDPRGGPVPGSHNFFRGGSLKTYDGETRKAIAVLKGKINVKMATEIWETALATSWPGASVWVHGDISAGNLLVREGRLNAVIDFGGLAIGDPACDLAIAWTLFEGKSRDVFHQLMTLDAGTWARGRAWTLWKALIIAAGLTESNAVESTRAWQTIDEVLADYKQNH
jgi:aminoglycoside phosphotransferase (APT) family kinase protein